MLSGVYSALGRVVVPSRPAAAPTLRRSAHHRAADATATRLVVRRKAGRDLSPAPFSRWR